MRPSMWHIAALQSCLTNFDWKKEEEEEIEENVGEKEKQCRRTLKEMC